MLTSPGIAFDGSLETRERSMPTYERFKLALSNADGAHWRDFERLATVVLMDEYPSLRPMAAASGDGGMDAVLFQSSEDPDVVLQFSVRQDWETKITQTIARLMKTAPETSMLVFATNQQVGPKANAVKRRIRSESGLFLDVRDAGVVPCAAQP